MCLLWKLEYRICSEEKDDARVLDAYGFLFAICVVKLQIYSPLFWMSPMEMLDVVDE